MANKPTSTLQSRPLNRWKTFHPRTEIAEIEHSRANDGKYRLISNPRDMVHSHIGSRSPSHGLECLAIRYICAPNGPAFG